MELERSVRDIVGTVAPTLALALDGPLASMAARVVAGVLLGREDATAEQITAAVIAAGPAQLAMLKRADVTFRSTLYQLEIDIERVSAGRIRARAVFRDCARQVLAGTIIVGFMGAVLAVLSGQVKGLNDPLTSALVGTLIGYLAAAANQVISFYFGSTAGGTAKNQVIEQLAAKK
jgi:hypothetical protein